MCKNVKIPILSYPIERRSVNYFQNFGFLQFVKVAFSAGYLNHNRQFVLWHEYAFACLSSVYLSTQCMFFIIKAFSGFSIIIYYSRFLKLHYMTSHRPGINVDKLTKDYVSCCYLLPLDRKLNLLVRNEIRVNIYYLLFVCF